MRAWIAGLVIFAACKVDAERPAFQDLPIRLYLERNIGDAPPFETTHPLRAALTFLIPTATVTTTDVALPEGATIVDLTLIDPQLTADEIKPRVASLLNRTGVSIFFPQLSIYEDRDRSGTQNAGDRLVALDYPPKIVFHPEPDRFLFSSVTFPAMQSYYEATGDRYSRFLRVQQIAGEFLAVRHDTELVMMLAPSVFLDEAARCWPRALRGVQDDEPVERRSRVILEVEGVTTSTVPELIQQCRTDGTTDAYIRGTISEGCKDCVCGSIEALDVYLTRTSSAPDTWPCGRELEYCASSLPIQELDPSCLDTP